jgi:hypothetical protein
MIFNTKGDLWESYKVDGVIYYNRKKRLQLLIPSDCDYLTFGSPRDFSTSWHFAEPCKYENYIKALFSEKIIIFRTETQI